MPINTPAPPTISSTQLQQEVQVNRGYGINALTPLLKPPHIELIQTTVRAYVQEQSAATRIKALPILEVQSRGVAEVTFELNTLLQLLSWERLAAKDSLMSDTQLKQLFDDMLDGEQGKEIGRRLNVALGWYGAADGEFPDPIIVRQLTWKALILELDPPEHQKSGHIAGYEVAMPKNWGRPWSEIQQEFESFLGWKARTVQGWRSRNAARLAARILAPMMPELAVRETPEMLRYGTGRWVNFAHDVALVELLFPGSSQTLTYEQLVDIPVNLSDLATDSERRIIIEARMAPAVQWATANNILPVRATSYYSVSEVEDAMAALDEYQRKAADSINTLLQKIPDRTEIGLKKFNEVIGPNANALKTLVMRPTTFGDRLYYSWKNPSPNNPAGSFYLLDLFVAGFMKDGTDKFEPDLQVEQSLYNDLYTEDIMRLKGIDIGAMYQEAFDAYSRDAKAAYILMIETLLSELPYLDRLAVEYGRVDLYLLESETGKNINEESRRDRELRQGRQGFILVCNYNRTTFAYEVFPLLGILRRRTELHPIPAGGLLKQVSTQIHRAGVQFPVDWKAYEMPMYPRSDTVSNVIPVQFASFPAVELQTSPLISPLSSPRLKSIATFIANRNLFFDTEIEFRTHKHQTGSEYVTATYPPVLRIMEVMIPGLACFNAIRTNESPVITCAIDIGLILAKPFFGYAQGFVTLVVKSGALAVGRTLPAVAKLTRKFIVSGATSFRSGLNPAEGFLFRWGVVPGSSAYLVRLAYKLNEAVGRTLGKPGEFAYINDLESASVPHKWRPVSLGDRLAMINGVPDVPVRSFPTTDNSVRSYLINSASGNPYGPPLEAEL